MNVLKILGLLANLLPVISAFVTQVETTLVGATGQTKFATVFAAVEAYLAKIEQDVNIIAALKDQLGPLINAAVAMFNISGLFSHAAPVVTNTAVSAATTGASSSAAAPIPAVAPQSGAA